MDPGELVTVGSVRIRVLTTPSMAGFGRGPLVFLAAMLVAMATFRWWQALASERSARAYAEGERIAGARDAWTASAWVLDARAERRRKPTDGPIVARARA